MSAHYKTKQNDEDDDIRRRAEELEELNRTEDLTGCWKKDFERLNEYANPCNPLILGSTKYPQCGFRASKSDFSTTC